MAGTAQRLNPARLAAWLTERGNRLDHPDLGNLWKQVAVALSADAKRRFVEGNAPDGTPWQPLARPRGRKRDRKKRKGQGADKPLRDTGLLMASLTASGVGAPQHVERVTESGMIFGTSVPYASFHQHGTSRIPARPFLGISPRLQTALRRLITDYLVNLLGS